MQLGTLPGLQSSFAQLVNSNGMIVGSCVIIGNESSRRGFVWTATGGMVDIGHLGGGGPTDANFVSDQGIVVGTSPNLFGGRRGFAWSAGGGITNMGALGGVDSAPLGMNRSGTVMGYATGPEQAWQYAFAWSATNGIQALTLGGNSVPRALSEAGHIVGYSSTSNGNSRGFRWEAGEGIVELPAPGGISGGYSDAVAVNSTGQVAGWATFDDNSNLTRAALWLDPPPQPRLQIKRAAGQIVTFELLVDQLVPYIPFTVQRSVNFVDWESLGRYVPSAISHTVSNMPISGLDSAFYRIRIP